MILYATIFVLGMAYVILYQDNLAGLTHWRQAWIATSVLWAVLVGAVVWLRRRAEI
ncbi:MAG: hypothetical protein WA718_21015 [Terriglobales bacterium]